MTAEFVVVLLSVAIGLGIVKGLAARFGLDGGDIDD